LPKRGIMKLLRDVHEDHYFIVADGTMLKNLKELAEHAPQLEAHVFDHHVNDDRHDFHNWVRDVHKDASLAKSMLKARTPEEVAQVITRRIKRMPAKPRKNAHTRTKPPRRRVTQHPQPLTKHAKHQILAGSIAGVAVLFIVGIVAGSSSITGAVVGPSALSQAGVFAIGAILTLFALVLYGLHIYHEER
jgi:hypothetical protein